MNQPQVQGKTEFSIHPRTRIGHVSLKVKDLDSQIRFYQQVIGLGLNWRERNEAGLGAGEADIVRLTEHPAFMRYRGVTGLYHFAILFPNRRELARVVRRLFALKYRNYPTDHIMTKTTYLDDPEGNGIELYAESPEDGAWSLANGEYITRRADGSLSDGREPLDLEALFSNLMEDDKLDVPAPAETRVGHVHLHVRDVEEAVAFYHGVLGFDVCGETHANGFCVCRRLPPPHWPEHMAGCGRAATAGRCTRAALLPSAAAGRGVVEDRERTGQDEQHLHRRDRGRRAGT
jgi:catechol 2,3-dioxygenase